MRASLVILVAAVAALPFQPQTAHGHEVDLSRADLDAITVRAVELFPMAATAPEVRQASAWEQDGVVHANVVFKPYEVSQSEARSFSLNCDRPASSTQWTCLSGSVRSYLTFADFERPVSVMGVVNYRLAEAAIRAGMLEVGEGATPLVIVPQSSPNAMTVVYGSGDGDDTTEVEMTPITEDGRWAGFKIVSMRDR